MILTQCAVCATELGLSSGKKCGRCSTRYCGPECQKQHWEGGGHDKLCRKIKKAGGAEQYYANTKYAEAVSVAAEECAEDTKGQTCYICTQALHWKTKEGLVRGCACRGTAGFAHVSCLAEQAKILYDEVEENNLDWKTEDERWKRWYKCSLCEQRYHGVVHCALGWACWKTYLGRPEADPARGDAMSQLGRGLSAVEHFQDALSVEEAELSMRRRRGDPEDLILAVQGNIARTHRALGRLEEALRMRRDVYSGFLKLLGNDNRHTLIEGNGVANLLNDLNRFEEAKSLLRKIMPVARRVLGENHEVKIAMRMTYASALCLDAGATLDDLREAVTMLEDMQRYARRVFGGTHPMTAGIERCLQNARAALLARQGDDVSAVCATLDAMKAT
jgi:tetratricopeptide (TPR) repeat protein